MLSKVEERGATFQGFLNGQSDNLFAGDESDSELMRREMGKLEARAELGDHEFDIVLAEQMGYVRGLYGATSPFEW